MKRGFAIALALAGCLMAARALVAQSGDDKKPAANSQQAAPQSAPAGSQSSANPFPTDTNDVPLMPTSVTPDIPAPPSGESEDEHFSLPSSDTDPAASPDTPPADNGDVQTGESSSTNRNLDSLLPAPGDDDTGKRGKRRGVSPIVDAPKETAAGDISVGKYYLDNKNWRAALSRYQSALVLSPDDPDVYWGLAESQRHLGDFASAKANYEKVVEYDPDSKHGKEAKKALKDPEIANAKPLAAAQAQK
jgi:tetratricopeptide (TPR) repeat protein